MQKPMIDRESLAKWLGDIISEEMKKSDSEIDWDLVDECEAYLAELYSDVVISEKELKANIAKIKASACNVTSSPKRSRKPRMRCLLAAGLAAALLFCCAVTAYAFVPQFREAIQRVLCLNPGTAVSEDGVTYVYAGETINYQSIDDLIQSEKIDILYPHNLSDNLKIKSVIGITNESGSEYYISFVDEAVSFSIKSGEIDVSDLSLENPPYKNQNEIVSYISSDNGIFIAVTVFNGYTYYVTTYDESQLITILESLY